MKLRALVSAKAADKLYALRCELREKLLAFLRDLDAGRYYAHQRHAPAPPTPTTTPTTPTNGTPTMIAPTATG